MRFDFPPPTHSRSGGPTLEGNKTRKWVALKEAIGDLPDPQAARDKNRPNEQLKIPNHEYMTGSFSTIYMSRNRKKCWNDQSYTIQAGGRHAPLHPTSTEMMKIGKDEWTFKGSEPRYRRLSVRECARIQTFPADFVFYYKNVADGYTMIGNAVPVKLAEAIAEKIKSDIK
jgi:DNA (cytosine-5)-methyltransferase 1